MVSEQLSVHTYISILFVIQPLALARLSQANAASNSLFEYESIHLSEESFHRIGNDTIDENLRRLFGIEGRPTLGSGECRAYPGDSDWPAQHEWDALNDLLGGALIPTVPVAASCYSSWGVFDKERCEEVTLNFSNPYFQ
jgi:hypothetical protein